MVPLPGRERRDRVVRGRFSAFASGQGLGAAALAPEVIEAFAMLGLAGRTTSTAGTYRSVLRRLAEQARPEGAAGFAGSVAKAPYSPVERTALWSMATAQPKAWRAHSTLVVLALALGAGLRAGEIAQATCSWISVEPGTAVRVVVEGACARTVVVKGPSGAVLTRYRHSSKDTYLFHPDDADRSYHNFVNYFLAKLDLDPQSPKPTVARCRSSFICDHLASGTPLAALLEMTGINEVESLLRYARHVDGAPQSKAGLRHRLKEERP